MVNNLVISLIFWHMPDVCNTDKVIKCYWNRTNSFWEKDIVVTPWDLHRLHERVKVKNAHAGSVETTFIDPSVYPSRSQELFTLTCFGYKTQEKCDLMAAFWFKSGKCPCRDSVATIQTYKGLLSALNIFQNINEEHKAQR